MIYYILGFVVVWIVCGILAYGITFAYFWREYPLLQEIPSEVLRNRRFAILMTCGGPISLIVVFFCSNFAKHGLKFK